MKKKQLNSLESVEILGIKVNQVTYKKTLDILLFWLKDKKHRYLVTPNPEIIVHAQSDPQFAKILNSADLSIPDGSSLIWASRGRLATTVTGTDLMTQICQTASRQGWKIGLLGGTNDTVALTNRKLQKMLPNIKIVFAKSGGKVDNKGNLVSSQIIDQHKNIAIDILFVAFGFPKQEYWIAKNKDKFPSIVFIPVGGAFDYISGKVKRAPVALRKAGLEWLYRLITQPTRFPRQLRAAKFFYFALKEKISRQR